MIGRRIKSLECNNVKVNLSLHETWLTPTTSKSHCSVRPGTTHLRPIAVVGGPGPLYLTLWTERNLSTNKFRVIWAKSLK